jgi:hypothetical protein
MQVNHISMESAKCAQSNKTCCQSEIWYLFAKIRVKGQNEFFFTVFAMNYYLSFFETFKNIMSSFFSKNTKPVSKFLSYRWFSDLYCIMFLQQFCCMYRRSDPCFYIIFFFLYSFYENSDTFICNKMHIYRAYCRNNLKRQSVFIRPIVS